MAWLACDEGGTEAIYYRKPFRGLRPQNFLWLPNKREQDEQSYINLPKGTIEKLIGRPMTWADEPQEI